MHDNVIPSKRCSRCGEPLPIDRFGPQKRNRDGLRGWCRPCGNAYVKARYVPGTTRKDPSPPGFKRCGHCRDSKTHAEFNRNRWTADGFQSYCRVCQRESGREWARAHPEQQADYRAKNRAACNARAAAWRKNNPEKRREIIHRYYERHKDRLAAYAKRHLAERPEVHARAKAMRKLRERSTRVGKIRYAQIRRQHGSICHICGGHISPDQFTFDHVVPLSRGGRHVTENIRPAHATCNARKASRLLDK